MTQPMRAHRSQMTPPPPMTARDYFESAEITGDVAQTLWEAGQEEASQHIDGIMGALVRTAMGARTS